MQADAKALKRQPYNGVQTLLLLHGGYGIAAGLPALARRVPLCCTESVMDGNSRRLGCFNMLTYVTRMCPLHAIKIQDNPEMF